VKKFIFFIVTVLPCFSILLVVANSIGNM